MCCSRVILTVECPLIYVHFYLLIKCPIVTFNFIFCSKKSTCLSQLLHTNLFSHVAVYFFLRLYCKFVANEFYLLIKCQLVLVYSFVPIDCYHLCISSISPPPGCGVLVFLGYSQHPNTRPIDPVHGPSLGTLFKQ